MASDGPSMLSSFGYTTDFGRRRPFVRFYVGPTSPTPPKSFGVLHSKRPWQLMLAQLPTQALRLLAAGCATLLQYQRKAIAEPLESSTGTLGVGTSQFLLPHSPRSGSQQRHLQKAFVFELLKSHR
ncbi:hypothetical protein PCANC_11062 [Puccinia coronata f. sp. avenae]|uniref:Uncharacterized protein n=1 Tax=Puccinia coronata f. sp. avenae TaxID=200324 RepID=A0A2N5UVU6_9BASI|nr:hypothetical protein PCANC_11062 [Puccinia coronata f. sp. avenae]